MPLRTLTCQVFKFGIEQEPVVVLDGFADDFERLKSRALSANYAAGQAYYPGIQAGEDPNYLGVRGSELTDIFATVFGVRNQIRIESSSYSIVTKARGELLSGQCVPHYDGPEQSLWACLHYIQGPKEAGTAFYRHRRTGFETISVDRVDAYRMALQSDVDEFGVPPNDFFYGDDDRYELIGEIQAVPDRLIIYRGNTLHSGCIPNSVNLSSDPTHARITLNSFLTT